MDCIHSLTVFFYFSSNIIKRSMYLWPLPGLGVEKSLEKLPHIEKLVFLLSKKMKYWGKVLFYEYFKTDFNKLFVAFIK